MPPENQTTHGESTPGLPDATLRALDVGQLIAGRFRLVRPLGKGGMGVVWLATDESLGEEVAFKFLAEILAQDEASLHDLKRELRRTRQLTHHHIIRVHDLVEDPARGVAGITMEVAAGGSLAARRAKTPHGWFEPEEIADWVRQLCEALDYAHRTARVVHRDLKPANLLLDAEGRLKIADFGIAAALHESATRLTQGKVSGTPLYMSPEQWQGYPPTPADDLYALGATLYELLAGKPPFYSGNIAAAVLNLPPISIAQRRHELESVVAPLPPEWEKAIAALLAKTAGQRPQSAGEVLAVLGLAGDPRWNATSGRVSETPTASASEPDASRRQAAPGKETRPEVAFHHPSGGPSPESGGDEPVTLAANREAPAAGESETGGWPWLRPLLRRRWLAVLVWGALTTLTWTAVAEAAHWRHLFNVQAYSYSLTYTGIYGPNLADEEIWATMVILGVATSWLPLLLLKPRWWGYLLWLLGAAVWICFLLINVEKMGLWRYGSDAPMPSQMGWWAWLLVAALVSAVQAMALMKVRRKLWLPGLATFVVLVLQSCLNRLLIPFGIYLYTQNDWENWLALQGIGSLLIAAAWFYGTRPRDYTRTSAPSSAL